MALSTKTLRKLHAWGGFYAALALVFFSVTGFLLNHRAIFKIPALQKSETRVVLSLAAPFEKSDDMNAWLAKELDVPPERIRLTRFDSKPAAWRNGEVQIPERWTARADFPHRYAEAEYWLGERRIEIKRQEPNLWMHLARYHMGIGVGSAWVLFADTVALVLGLMGLSGLFLWTRLHGARQLGWGLVGLGAGLAGLAVALSVT